MVKGLLMLFKWFASSISVYGRFIPTIFAVVFITAKFLMLMTAASPPEAIRYLATQLLSSEFVIHEGVELAISNSPDYTIFTFLEIVTSAYVLFSMMGLMGKGVRFLMSESAPGFGVYTISAFVIFLLEWAVAWSVQGQWQFIPLWDGLFFLVLNLSPVLQNLQIFGWHFLQYSELFETNLNITENATVVGENLTNTTI